MQRNSHSCIRWGKRGYNLKIRPRTGNRIWYEPLSLPLLVQACLCSYCFLPNPTLVIPLSCPSTLHSSSMLPSVVWHLPSLIPSISLLAQDDTAHLWKLSCWCLPLLGYREVLSSTFMMTVC